MDSTTSFRSCWHRASNSFCVARTNSTDQWETPSDLVCEFSDGTDRHAGSHTHMPLVNITPKAKCFSRPLTRFSSGFKHLGFSGGFGGGFAPSFREQHRRKGSTTQCRPDLTLSCTEYWMLAMDSDEFFIRLLSREEKVSAGSCAIDMVVAEDEVMTALSELFVFGASQDVIIRVTSTQTWWSFLILHILSECLWRTGKSDYCITIISDCATWLSSHWNFHRSLLGQLSLLTDAEMSSPSTTLIGARVTNGFSSTNEMLRIFPSIEY